jgi:Ser/Thr protein kinase RdoA (MazF antagonist)
VATSRTRVDGVPVDLAERYGLPPFEQAEPLGGGYHNTLLRAGDWVIRIEARAPESVAWEHGLVGFLAVAIPEVLAPLRALDGSSYLVEGDRVVSLLPFVEGERGGEGAAELLARIHLRALEWPAPGQRPGRPSYRDLDWERNDWWDWSVVPKPPELVRAFERVRRFVADAPPLVVCPVHGDLAAQNLISRNGRVAALIDWEYARLDWPALELANAAWTLADDPYRFVDEYAAAGGPGEREYLDEGIRLRLVANALYQLTRAAEGGAWSRDWVEALLAELRELE